VPESPALIAAAAGARPISSAARETFAECVEPHRRQIKAYCYRMVGSLHEAEDLVQETFLRAWQSIEGFEGRGSLQAWLFQIATRVCLDALAQRRRLRRVLPEAAFPPATDSPSGMGHSNIS
jgi:RNA polymerase sigma-70 factor, ECF subfamily